VASASGAPYLLTSDRCFTDKSQVDALQFWLLVFGRQAPCGADAPVPPIARVMQARAPRRAPAGPGAALRAGHAGALLCSCYLTLVRRHMRVVPSPALRRMPWSSGRDGADTALTGRGCRQGVKLLFEDHTTGVMLLQAPGSIPSSFNVYLAGVNATAGAVPAAGACIQHPGGGGKRIAIASGACAPGAPARAACPSFAAPPGARSPGASALHGLWLLGGMLRHACLRSRSERARARAQEEHHRRLCAGHAAGHQRHARVGHAAPGAPASQQALDATLLWALCSCQNSHCDDSAR
jgi:hypothetical protein